MCVWHSTQRYSSFSIIFALFSCHTGTGHFFLISNLVFKICRKHLICYARSLSLSFLDLYTVRLHWTSWVQFEKQHVNMSVWVSRVVCDWTQETDAVTRDPARMAASIQALARSVHGNTSEIFGELPRPPTRFRSTNQRSGTHCWHMNWTLTLCCAVDCQHHYIFSSFAFLLHECREFVRIVDCSILCKRNIVCCL